MKKNLRVFTQHSASCLRQGGLVLLLAGAAPAAFGQTFAPAATYDAGNNSNPLGVAVADVNADGRPDIVTANNGSSTVGLFLNKGAGAFQAVTTISTGANGQPSGVVVADVNADGKPDILTANQTTSTAGVLLGNGNGTFQVAVAYSTGTGSQPSGLTVADVNADGKPDIITANSNGNLVGVLLGNGNGTFQAMTAYATGPANSSSQPKTARVADVNADGKLDIITANSNTNPSGAAGVLLGNGNGTFQAIVTYTTGSSTYPSAAAVADMNGDGKPDIVSANPGNYSAGVLLGKGNGTFQPIVTFLLGKSIERPYDVAAVDVNGDNKPDIVTCNVSTNTISVLLNTATFLATRPEVLPAQLTLAPNPASAGTTFALTTTNLPTAVRSLEATLLNAVGQTVSRATIAAAQGTAHAELPTAGLAPGIYLLRLRAHDAQGAAVGALPAQRLCVR